MRYLISILVLTTIITVWGYCFSKWRHARGGCGCSGANRGGHGRSTCCQDPDKLCDGRHEES